MIPVKLMSNDDTVAPSPLKKIHCVDGHVFVKIDDKIAKELSLDTDEVWVEQNVAQDGILMKIKRRVKPKND